MIGLEYDQLEGAISDIEIFVCRILDTLQEIENTYKQKEKNISFKLGEMNETAQNIPYMRGEDLEDARMMLIESIEKIESLLK